MVFAKSYCPYCKATRALFKTIRSSIDIEINFLDLDKMDEEDGPLVQMELLQLTGQRTVPNGEDHRAYLLVLKSLYAHL